MYVIGKSLDNLFFGLFYLKEELYAFCPNSRIRLFLYDPEVIEANNPTD